MTLFLLFSLFTVRAQAEPPPSGLPTQGYIASVYDGDTFTLESGEKIRLRWVNTPELKPKEPYGDEARHFATEYLHRRSVTLTPATRDSYGRVVAGVATEAGDLSLALVEHGLAHVFVIPPDETDITPLLAAQDRAREAGRGIWSDPMFQGALHITSFHANAPGDDALNLNGEYLRLCNMSAGPVDLSGWAIREGSGSRWPLPAMMVPPGHTVRVHVGPGTSQTDPSRQLVAQLGSTEPIFDNDGDVADLLDPEGRLVDQRVHAPKSR